MAKLSVVVITKNEKANIGHFVKGGYKDRLHGLVAAAFAAFYAFVKHIKLWENALGAAR